MGSRAGRSLTGRGGRGPRSRSWATCRAFIARGWRLPKGGGRRLLFTASDRNSERVEWCEVDAYEDVPLNYTVRTGAAVDPLTLRTEQAEDLGRLRPVAAEPVRDPGVELGHLARAEHQVVVAEDEPHPPGQDVEPLVALMRTQPRSPLLGGTMIFHACTPPGCRVSGITVRPFRLLGLEPNAGVAHLRRADEIVERDPVGLRQRQQQLQAGAALTGLQPRQRALGDARSSRPAPSASRRAAARSCLSRGPTWSERRRDRGRRCRPSGHILDPPSRKRQRTLPTILAAEAFSVA